MRWPTATEVREAYRVRAELEGLAAQLAAQSIDDLGLARLESAVATFPRGEHEDSTLVRATWQAANNAFHDAVIGSAGNARLGRSIAELHRSFPRNLTWSALQETGDLFDVSAAEHEAILTAVQRREHGEARHRMIEHVLSAGDLLATWFEQNGPSHEELIR